MPAYKFTLDCIQSCQYIYVLLFPEMAADELKERNRIMPKQKTHKGLTKRVKVTARGKVKRKRAFGSHLMSGKNAKCRRKIRGTSIVEGALAKTIREELGR